MVTPIPINLVVEDALSEILLRRILKESSGSFAIGYSYGGGGYGYIKQKARAFNNAAKGTPFLLLVDLEAECAPIQIKEWLPVPRHHNLLFRVAVNEVESWLLADRAGIASFLGIARKFIPENPDSISKPKQFLINLAKKSPRRALREAIVPSPNTTARVGPDYNGQLSSFVISVWNIREALRKSDSLCRAVNAISKFQPI